jgi:spore coat polysaccharide biosynthesis protein SpsF
MKTIAIIQARMSSTRLPGKVLADVAGRPLLAHLLERAARAETLDSTVIATTVGPLDDPIEELCRRREVPCFRGSEEDVLDRYHRAATAFGGDVIVRLTADCPVLDPAVIDQTVRYYLDGEFDYVSNALKPTFPNGLDAEVFSFAALDRAWREAALRSEREHVTPYIWKHPELFRLGSVEHDADLSAFRWTVDEPEDLELVREFYRHLGPASTFGMAEILALLERHPELTGINARFKRNEGYQKSLREDAATRAPTGTNTDR